MRLKMIDTAEAMPFFSDPGRDSLHMRRTTPYMSL